MGDVDSADLLELAMDARDAGDPHPHPHTLTPTLTLTLILTLILTLTLALALKPDSNPNQVTAAVPGTNIEVFVHGHMCVSYNGQVGVG